MVHGADRELLQSFQEPGSGVVVRFVALYRLRAVGNALTNSDNRVVDDKVWQLADRGRAEISYGGRQVAVASSQIVSGPRRRLVWSFYLVDGEITAGLLETKLLQARAVLLGRAPLAAFVAMSASEDDPDHRAAAQLTRFLQANQPLLSYLDALSRGKVASAGMPAPDHASAVNLSAAAAAAKCAGGPAGLGVGRRRPALGETDGLCAGGRAITR